MYKHLQFYLAVNDFMYLYIYIVDHMTSLKMAYEMSCDVTVLRELIWCQTKAHTVYTWKKSDMYCGIKLSCPATMSFMAITPIDIRYGITKRALLLKYVQISIILHLFGAKCWTHTSDTWKYDDIVHVVNRNDYELEHLSIYFYNVVTEKVVYIFLWNVLCLKCLQ